MGTFQEIEHTADYALRLQGEDLRDLLQAAGEGFIALVTDEGRPAPRRWAEYQVGADDPALLVLRAVRELLYYLDGGDLPVAWQALKAIEDPPAAGLRVGLVPLAEAGDHLHRHVKAVTYHDLEIRRDEQGLSLILTFDT
jgi:SHS2 domain-containing protein